MSIDTPFHERLVYVLWLEDNTSWSRTNRTFRGVFASRQAADDAMDDWAHRQPRRQTGYGVPGSISCGADGIDFVIEPHHVQG